VISQGKAVYSIEGNQSEFVFARRDRKRFVRGDESGGEAPPLHRQLAKHRKQRLPRRI
jgi:hypothetical protein